MFTLTPSSFQKCLHHVKVGAVVTRTQLNTLQIQLQRFIRFSVLQPHGFGGTTGCQRGGVVAKDFYSIKWILNECSWWRFQDLPSSQPFCCSSVTSATHEKKLQEPRSQKWNLSFLSALAALPYSTLQKRQEESEVGAKQWQATLIALLYESMGWHQKWSDLQRPIAFCVPKFQTSKKPLPKLDTISDPNSSLFSGAIARPQSPTSWRKKNWFKLSYQNWPMKLPETRSWHGTRTWSIVSRSDWQELIKGTILETSTSIFFPCFIVICVSKSGPQTKKQWGTAKLSTDPEVLAVHMFLWFLRIIPWNC